MGRNVTNDAIAQMLAASDKKSDERHSENTRRLERIEVQTVLTNGRVSAHDTEIQVIKALMTERRSQDDATRTPKTAVLKIGGAGTGLGILITKAIEWFQK